MQIQRPRAIRTFSVVASFVALAGLTAVVGASQQDRDNNNQNFDDGNALYSVHDLVADAGGPKADHSDADLVNAWGIVVNPTAFVWVADNGAGVATLYDGAGVKQSLVVMVPPSDTGSPPSVPTGLVYSGGSDFLVKSGVLSRPSRFIFAAEDGSISGWAPNVDGTHAILAVPHSTDGAVYKGLALGGNGTGHLLYAADFHNNKIDVFDAAFQPTTVPGGFRDPQLPPGFAPFNIQNILGNLYVMYAKQDKEKTDEEKGVGLGFVDVFDANGQLIRRFASRGRLNAPWGIALAPGDFGRFSNMLLIGNFGDGRINAFDLNSGQFRGQMRTSDHRVLSIDGLWGLAFGNGVASQPTSTLFFTAGPGDESQGLYGKIEAANATGRIPARP
ncbi:MAG TPA: TIGR03118 family protein [Vicinamibacterales bacterium]